MDCLRGILGSFVLGLGIVAGDTPDEHLEDADAKIVFTNSLGMKFVELPLLSAKHLDQEKVKIIYASIWETRRVDFSRFADTGYDPSKLPGKPQNWKEPGFHQEENHPVVFVSRLDAEAFCKWLTQKERREKTIKNWWTYRIPVDHEWSCMAGLGAREDPSLYAHDKREVITDHFLGNWKTWPPKVPVANLGGPELVEGSALPDDSYEATAPVGSFPPNELGIHDLDGNVSEWTAGHYMKPDERTEDYHSHFGILRGASYRCSTKRGLLTSLRYAQTNGARTGALGFRIVIDRGPPNPVQQSYPRK